MVRVFFTDRQTEDDTGIGAVGVVGVGVVGAGGEVLGAGILGAVGVVGAAA